MFPNKGFPFSRRLPPFSPVRHTFLRGGARSRGVKKKPKPQKFCEKVTHGGSAARAASPHPQVCSGVVSGGGGGKTEQREQLGIYGTKGVSLLLLETRWPPSKRFAHDRERVKPSIKALMVFCHSSCGDTHGCSQSLGLNGSSEQTEQWQEPSFVLIVSLYFIRIIYSLKGHVSSSSASFCPVDRLDAS